MTFLVRPIQFIINAGGTSQQVAVSTVSAQSGVINADLVQLTVQTAPVFVRAGAAPTAVADGTDQLFAVGTYQVAIPRGQRLAFIVGTGTATVNITPVGQ